MTDLPVILCGAIKSDYKSYQDHIKYPHTYCDAVATHFFICLQVGWDDEEFMARCDDCYGSDSLVYHPIQDISLAEYIVWEVMAS